jgi:hypothetical protein
VNMMVGCVLVVSKSFGTAMCCLETEPERSFQYISPHISNVDSVTRCRPARYCLLVSRGSDTHTNVLHAIGSVVPAHSRQWISTIHDDKPICILLRGLTHHNR